MIDMFRKKPVFQYESAVETYQNVIEPARKFVPDWYKKIPKWNNNQVFSPEHKGFNNTIKQCVPFLQSFTTGYMITLAFDIYVTEIDGQPCITWQFNNPDYVPSVRSVAEHKDLVPSGHYEVEFTWRAPVAYGVSPGYSFFLTHPINRYDLPFTTMSGFIDGGFVMKAGGNVPFYIKKGFEGIIPQGTPIAQIIPFRREDWNSKIQEGLILEGKRNSQRIRSVISGWYKKNIWKQTKYN